MAKSGRLELGDNIYGHYSSIFNHCDVFGQQSNRIRWKRKIRAIMPFKVIQGHRGRYQSKARIRAGFTLSRALFRKKCGALQLGRQTLFFLEKNGRPFLVITVRASVHVLLKNWRFFCSLLSFHSGVAHFSGIQKMAAPFVGAFFVGALVRANMLNMPKSAAGTYVTSS